VVSDIIDKLVEGAGQVISDVDKGGTLHSAISGIRQRMAEADRRRKINQVKQQIQDLRAQEAQAINALSAQVLALHEAGSLSQPELVSLCKNVDEIQNRSRNRRSNWSSSSPSLRSRRRLRNRRRVRRPQNPRRRCPKRGQPVPVAAWPWWPVRRSAKPVGPAWWRSHPRRCYSVSTAAPNCARGRVSAPSVDKRCRRGEVPPLL
jgi:hypothetical protein